MFETESVPKRSELGAQSSNSADNQRLARPKKQRRRFQRVKNTDSCGRPGARNDMLGYVLDVLQVLAPYRVAFAQCGAFPVPKQENMLHV